VILPVPLRSVLVPQILEILQRLSCSKDMSTCKCLECGAEMDFSFEGGLCFECFKETEAYEEPSDYPSEAEVEVEYFDEAS
jgi:hypothetical protein